MPIDRKLELLRARAARALGGKPVAQAVATVRAIIGPKNIPDSEVQAQAALKKLENGDINVTAEELAALEIVVRLLRPVVYSKEGLLEDLPDREGANLHPQELKDLWSTFRSRIKPLMGSIGRIETKDRRHIGTGFLVADGVLATNRHVLDALTFGTGVLAAGAARVVFKQEIDRINPPADDVLIEAVAAIHPKLDMVLLRVPKQGRPAVELEDAPVGEATRIAAIGYPGEDKVNNPLFLSGVFANRFGVKRAALGEVLDGTEAPDLFHDCSTTQGNSGSPLFSLTSGKVAGIHRAGFFMYRNEAVDAGALGTFVRGIG
jgi:S1-C subfamily serine protease